MEVIITPHNDYMTVHLTSEQIRSIKQLIDYEQLYETNTDTNEYWNQLRRQLNEN